MKQFISKILTFFIILICCSCNDDDVATADLNENIYLSQNETYEFIIGGYDSESVIEILQQPSNIQVSSIDYEQNPKRVYYRYTPPQDFIGEDEAMIYFKDVLSDEGGFRLTGKHYLKFNIKVE